MKKEKQNLVYEDFSHYSCFVKLYLKCFKKLNLNNELKDEREIIIASTKINLNNNDETHNRIMSTIYKSLTGELQCNQIGDHWTKIGFQGNDPKTDLHNIGIFGIVQILAFIERYTIYAKEILSNSSNIKNSFQFSNVLINLSLFTIECLRGGFLIEYCNKTNSVIATANDYFFGMIDIFYNFFFNHNETKFEINKTLEYVKKIGKRNTKLILI